MKTMKNLEFQIPKGYIQDMAKSTPDKLVYKLAKSDNIMERITCFGDALEELPNDDKDVIEYHKLINTGIAGNTLNFTKLKIFTKVLNEGWKPNMSNQNEYKYWNYFYMDNGTFSFTTLSHYSYLYVPSALFLKTAELAKHVIKIAFEEYKTYYLEK
jgi:hypothetical protein